MPAASLSRGPFTDATAVPEQRATNWGEIYVPGLYFDTVSDGLPPNGRLNHIIEETETLRRAIAAFHMEAIRFRMYSVDRALKSDLDAPDARARFEELRHTLEAAGFHTRSHTAP